MNYTINYPGAAAAGHTSQMTTPVTVNPQGQRTIVLSPPPQLCQGNVNGNSSGGSPQFPVVMQVCSSNAPVMQVGSSNPPIMQVSASNPGVMQVGSSNPPVFYTYQNPDGVVNNSPVQGGIANGSSAAVKICAENKAMASRSLNEILNMQGISALPNGGTIVQSLSNVPTNIISSLQSTGLQIVETSCANSANPPIAMPVVNVQASDMNADNMYKIIESGGNVTVITTGSNDSNIAQGVQNIAGGHVNKNERYF